MRSMKNIFLSAVFFAIAANVAHSDISAQARDKATVAHEFEAAFSRMIDDPTDIANTMKYAELAVELEDYESAIPPLERLLIQNPALTEVRLELGMMYSLLESKTVAKQYLTDVLEDENASEKQVALAKEYLAKL